jgi:hypothetical protein
MANNNYYAHDFHKEGDRIAHRAVLAEDFETFQKFRDFVKEHGMILCHCPHNVASKMVQIYTVFKPEEYQKLI